MATKHTLGDLIAKAFFRVICCKADPRCVASTPYEMSGNFVGKVAARVGRSTSPTAPTCAISPHNI